MLDIFVHGENNDSYSIVVEKYDLFQIQNVLFCHQDPISKLSPKAIFLKKEYYFKIRLSVAHMGISQFYLWPHL